MKELTVALTVMLAIFIWTAACFHANAQNYVDDWQAQQTQQQLQSQQNEIMRQQLRQQQEQEFNRQQEQIRNAAPYYIR